MGVVGKLSNVGVVLLSLSILFFIGNYSRETLFHPSVLVARDPTFEGQDAGIDTDTSSVVSQIFRRDDYTCGPGRPCANGACCGASGNCGFGDVYCGDGCTSNCNATAECGKHASPAGKKCPLNTCCSEFGFCGTTKVHMNVSSHLFQRRLLRLL